jgi:hypothetical protein
MEANNNEGLTSSSSQSDQGQLNAPDIMSRALHFLIHQTKVSDGGVSWDEELAIRFALSETVPKGPQEVQGD